MTPSLTALAQAAQLLALGNHIKANTVQIALPQGNVAIKDVTVADNFADVAAWYNQFGVSAVGGGTPGTAYWAFKTVLGKYDLVELPGVADDGSTATAFVIGGTTGGYVNRSQGERDAFTLIFNSVLVCRPYLANVRAAMDDIFSGSGAGAQANRSHVRALFRRQVTIAEHLFCGATPAGGFSAPAASGARGSRANPDLLGAGGLLEGNVTPAEIAAARAVAP